MRSTTLRLLALLALCSGTAAGAPAADDQVLVPLNRDTDLGGIKTTDATVQRVEDAQGPALRIATGHTQKWPGIALEPPQTLEPGAVPVPGRGRHQRGQQARAGGLAGRPRERRRRCLHPTGGNDRPGPDPPDPSHVGLQNAAAAEGKTLRHARLPRPTGPGEGTARRSSSAS